MREELGEGRKEEEEWSDGVKQRFRRVEGRKGERDRERERWRGQNNK